MKETGKTVMATPPTTIDRPEEAITAVRVVCVRVSQVAQRVAVPMCPVAILLKATEVIVLATLV